MIRMVILLQKEWEANWDNIHDKLNTNFEFFGLFSSLNKCYQDGEIKKVNG